MHITKIGHCCVLLEVDGVRILTDPGVCTTESHQALSDVDIIVITHEHADHFHSRSVQTLVAANPEVVVVGNQRIVDLLAEMNITGTCLEGTAKEVIAGISIRAWDGQHAEIYDTYGQVPSTGYLLAETVFLPGDSWSVPEYDVAALALPVAGPWCRIADAIRFACAVQPTVAFPVHDALLSDFGRQVTYPHPERELTASGIRFVSLGEGEGLTL